MQKIGIIGVGRMGHGIALNIAKSGRPVVYLEHPDNQPTDALQELGARARTTATQVARECDVIILCVTGTPEVEAVLMQADGVLAGIRAGTVVIDCSTAIPQSTLTIAAKVLEAEAHFLDAPMTRTPKEAAEGRLNLIVGGNADVFQAQLPLFECFAENITYAGSVSAGHTLKLIHNFVSLGFSAILAEAVTASGKSGIDPGVLLDVLENGGGRSVVLDRFKAYLVANNTEGFAFSLSNAAKDTGYYATMANDLGMNTQVCDSLASLYEQQVAAGEGERSIPELVSLL